MAIIKHEISEKGGSFFMKPMAVGLLRWYMSWLAKAK